MSVKSQFLRNMNKANWKCKIIWKKTCIRFEFILGFCSVNSTCLPKIRKRLILICVVVYRQAFNKQTQREGYAIKIQFVCICNLFVIDKWFNRETPLFAIQLVMNTIYVQICAYCNDLKPQAHVSQTKSVLPLRNHRDLVKKQWSKMSRERMEKAQLRKLSLWNVYLWRDVQRIFMEIFYQHHPSMESVLWTWFKS